MTFNLRLSPLDINGNALADTTFADAYFGDRGIAAWTGSSSVKQNALVQATDYIDTRFSDRYTDDVLLVTGSVIYPLVSGGTVPIKLARACCEYALRALTAPLAPDPAIDPSGASVVTKHKKVGPLEKEFEVVGSRFPVNFKPYPAADILLKGLLNPGSTVAYR